MGPRPAATPATRIVPGRGQEPVWDFPRPPRVEPSTDHVVIRLGGQVVVWILAGCFFSVLVAGLRFRPLKAAVA